MIMKKIYEIIEDTINDKDSLSVIGSFLNKYPTENGYRVECFISPKFIHVTVYKVGE